MLPFFYASFDCLLFLWGALIMARTLDRDWSNVDWSKSNTELAQELGVVRGTVHAQRKRYAPSTLPGAPLPEPDAAPPEPIEEPARAPILTVPRPTRRPRRPSTAGELAVADLPAPEPVPVPREETVTFKPRPVRHWSRDLRVARRIPHGIGQLDGLHFRVDEDVFTARAVLDAVREAGEDWAIGIAARLGVCWSPEVTGMLEALTDLGILERRLAFHPESGGGAFVHAYSVRVPQEDPAPHAPS